MIPAISDEAARYLSRYALPLSLKARAVNLPWEGGNRGTLTLLKLPQRHIAVTCCHVLDKLTELKRLDSSAEMVAYLVTPDGLAELDEFSLIDHDRQSLDVATFRGTEDDIFLPGMRFIDYQSSYLPDPAVGEPVIIVGYPGANVAVSRDVASFGYTFMCYRASTVSERQVKIANEHDTWSFCDYENPELEGIDLGGLSGSPAFAIRDGMPRFIGIVTDCSQADFSRLPQTIIISRLGCINPDGTLDHNSIPW